jgi:hypothetical protein
MLQRMAMAIALLVLFLRPALSALPIAVDFTPPVSDAYIEDIVPITLLNKNYPDLMLLWAVGDGTQSVPIQMLSYNSNANAYTDTTTNVIQGAIPKILNPRNFVVTRLNASGYDSIIIANQGFDASPWPGTTDTLLMAQPNGKLLDESRMLPSTRAYSHDISSGTITRAGTVGIFVNNIYSETETPPYLLAANKATGKITNISSRLPSSLDDISTAYTSSALVDVNGDGLADLVLGAENLTAGPSYIFLNPGNGNFSAASPTTLPRPPLPASKGLYSNTPTGPSVLDIRPIHISSPKYNDLIVVSTNGNYAAYAIQILINDGHGHFTDQTKTRLLGAPSHQIDSAATPGSYWLKRAWVFLVDGVPEIVTEAGGGLLVPSQVFKNDGAGHFKLALTVHGESFANAMNIRGQPYLIETDYEHITLVPFPNLVAQTRGN